MTLVANRGGRRKILWRQLLKISLVIIPITTAACSLGYFAMTQHWNPMAAWLGLAGGFGTVLFILIVHLSTPKNRLPFVR
jgi:hypothetical protein